MEEKKEKGIFGDSSNLYCSTKEKLFWYCLPLRVFTVQHA